MRPYKTICCAERDMVTFIGYFYFMQVYAILTPCMTVNCALHYMYNNYVTSTFKAGQRE